MRRGTPSAELFGGLLELIRAAGTGDSMRQIGDKIGAPAATVSQVEKGQRALKAPKIALWATALGVDESDLLELWRLSQGEVVVGGRPIFYAAAGEGLGTGEFKDSIARELKKRPDLEPIFRLAELIVVVLRRVLPNIGIQVDPYEYEPLHVDDMAAGLTLTAAQQDEQADHHDAFVPLPVIECWWDDAPGTHGRAQIGSRREVGVPLLQELAPIVRRRGKSMGALEFDELIRSLSGPERERVRGYVEAIIEQRD